MNSLVCDAEVVDRAVNFIVFDWKSRWICVFL